MAFIVTKGQTVVKFAKKICCVYVGFLYEGKEGKNNNHDPTLEFWPYQEFHLHFVASSNPLQLLARDFLSLETHKDPGWRETAVHQQEQVEK